MRREFLINGKITWGLLGYFIFYSIIYLLLDYFVFHPKNIFKTISFIILVIILFFFTSKKFILGILKKNELLYEVVNLSAIFFFIPIWVLYFKDYVGVQVAILSTFVSIPTIISDFIKIKKLLNNKNS